MTLGEMKKKTLALIEELDTNDKTLTGDPDIANKINYVINQIQNELSRIKKIPAYKEMDVLKDELIKFEDLDTNVYQISVVHNIDHEYKADGTIIKALENGKAEVEYYIYPTQIDDTTSDTQELDLSIDVLEIMPYGIAADVLKSDVSNGYGNIYANRYNELKQLLDMRYNTGSIEIEGGY